MIADLNKGFTQEELAFIQNQQLQLPADIFLQTFKEPNYVKQILDKSGEMNKELGRKKAHLSTTKANRKKNKDEIAEYDEGIEIIRKYRQRIGILEEGTKTLKVGKGIYTQKKRNAYKINPIDRFHSRDQYLDYRCYAAILVYLNGKQTGSVLHVEHGFVHDRWLWQQKWTR